MAGWVLAVLPAVCGFLVWRRLHGDAPRLECLAYALPVGGVLVALEMLILTAAAGGYRPLTLAVPLTVIGIACAWPRGPRPESGQPGLRASIGWSGGVALALIVVEIVL